MFGLTESNAARPSSRGKSRGVVLVRQARRTSWLAGWTPAPEPRGEARRDAPPAAERSTPTNPDRRR